MGNFRILIVDDDRAGAYLLRELMKNLRSRPELHFASDGIEALDFLHRRGAHRSAPRPNLILLDVNMPRLGGIETLSAIKSHPELYSIPVIMLSSSVSPDEVRDSYQARANGYVQKPVDLERSEKLVQAVEAFWMDFALASPQQSRTPNDGQSADSKPGKFFVDALPNEIDFGESIALQAGEAKGQAMQHDSPENKNITPPRRSGCEEHNRLLDEFGGAVRNLLTLHEQQFQAIVDGDSECTRFDLLIHMANEKKQQAKYAYLRHVAAHGCSN